MKPLSWIKAVAAEIPDEIPLFGNALPLDWNKASELVSSAIGVPVELRRAEQKMRSISEDDATVLPLKVNPLEGSAYWICSDVKKLTHPLTQDLSEGYYRFLILQVLNVLSSLPPFQTLSFVLSESSPPPQTETLCIDIEIKIKDQTVWGRLAIDPELQKSWAHHFSTPTEQMPLSKPLSSELHIGVKVGSIELTSEEWDAVKPGDFIPLGKSGYNPRKHEGAAFLMLRETPLFQVKIKNNKIELLDYPILEEEFLQPLSEVLISVELAHYKVTLEKLLEFAPGTILDLPIHPNQAAKLTSSGKPVGEAELVHLGEAFGIRILG